jgi:DNA-binding XRE family transcriptional regulator
MIDRIKSRAEQVVERRTGRELPGLLRELYVEKRHTQEEIAEAIGVHRITVLKWLREFDITRDERPPVAL